MSFYTSFQCNGSETLFLFEILNIPEAEQLRAELHAVAGRGEAAPSYTQILKDLVQDHVINISDQEITLEAQVHTLLTACKLSSAVTRLSHSIRIRHIRNVWFLSSNLLVEWIWKPMHHQSIFTSYPSLQDMFQVLGNRLDMNDTRQKLFLIWDKRVYARPSGLTHCAACLNWR